MSAGSRVTIERATLIALVSFAAISTDLYLAAIPDIMADLQASRADAQLTLSVFMVGFAIGQIFIGSFSDYFGRIRVIKTSLGVYIVASLICLLASAVEVLWVGRLLQGMAAASGPVIARAMVRDRYQGGEAVRVMSSLAAAMSVVPLVAPVLGGWLLYIGNWRGEFVLLLGFALFTWSGVRGMPETSPAIGLHKPDISAIARQMAMCFGDRCFLGFVVCGGAGFATLFVWITSSAFVITDTFGLPATQFGYFYAPGVVGYALGAHSGSRMLKRWSTLQLLKFSVIVLLCGAVMMQLQADGSAAHAGGVLIATALMAVGVGMLLPLCQMGAISRFDTYAGAASSTFGFSQTLLCALVSVSVAQIKGETLAVMGSLMLVTAVLSACGLVLLVRDQNQRK